MSYLPHRITKGAENLDHRLKRPRPPLLVGTSGLKLFARCLVVVVVVVVVMVVMVVMVTVVVVVV